MTMDNQLKPYQAFCTPERLNREGLIAFRINGDDMSPEYRRGDMVLVDTLQRIPCDCDYLLESMPGIFMVKSLQPHIGRPTPNPKIRVISRNPKYETYEAHVQDLGIVGRVIAKWVWKE